MGNKVSAQASVNINSVQNPGSPPPECPMHNKANTWAAKETEKPSECPVQHDKNTSETKKPSECPVQHGNDINPYNMVINPHPFLVD